MVTRAARAPGRDRAATRGRILDAVGRVLARQGFPGLGVNAVAREAGVDKVLIYRYFGGLPALLGAFAERGEFWPTAAELAGPAAEPAGGAAARGTAMLMGLVRGLRARPTTQEVLRWELSASNELTARLAVVRERRGLALLRRVARVRDLPSGTDLPAVAAVLSAGLIYLVLRAKSAPRWLGISLRDEEGWVRLERAVQTIVQRVAAPDGRPPARPGAPGSSRPAGRGRAKASQGKP